MFASYEPILLIIVCVIITLLSSIAVDDVSEVQSTVNHPLDAKHSNVSTCYDSGM